MCIKVYIPCKEDRKHYTRHCEETWDWGRSLYHFANKSNLQITSSMSLDNPSSEKSLIVFFKDNLSSYFQKVQWNVIFCRKKIAHATLSGYGPGSCCFSFPDSIQLYFSFSKCTLYFYV